MRIIQRKSMLHKGTP